MKLFSKTFTLFALILLNIFICGTYVRSEDDIVDDNGDDAVVNDSEQTPQQASEESETDAGTLQTSQFASTHLLFIQPESLELPAGKTVRLAASLRNKGSEQGLLVEHISASLRYPQDFQYHIQNVNIF